MRLLLFTLCLWHLPVALQAQCGSPDTNCDDVVNVNDLLMLLGYFGATENGTWNEAEDCSSPDVNCDGNVNVADLLGLLSYFGQSDADSDGIWDSEDDCVCALAGCTDNTACNYDPQATEEDGSCVEFNWNQIGSDINGEGPFDNCGRSVSLSHDGSIMAVGAPGSIEGGKVRVYAWDGNVWVQRGLDIDAMGSFLSSMTQTGWSVSLSLDGSIVAIGYPGFDADFFPSENIGLVRVYAWDGSAWVQRGLDIDGQYQGGLSGRSVSLSHDGSIIAVGAPGLGLGWVRIYAWDGSAWVQRGLDIIGGLDSNDRLGSSVSLSSDGSIVAIGAPGGGDGDAGYVRIYAWDGSAWVERGLDINGELLDVSGASVSLSSDGSIVAIGAPFQVDAVEAWGGESAGLVRVYAWDGNVWVQRGLDISGEMSLDESGWSVSLSSDGSIVAIGAPGGGDGDAGYVRIYAWDGSAWVQRGLDSIGGLDSNDRLGSSVSLSSDGSIVAIGAPYGGSFGGGYVGVYGISCDIVGGCTNLMAENFNPTANVDDGSCIIPGCLFEVACNYNPEATTDDGSCIFICPGCTEPSACNYDDGALQEDGSCLYPIDIYGASNVNCLGECLSDEDGDGVCLEDEVYGCTNSEACNYNNLSTEEDGSCEFLSCAGCTDEGACNFDPDATVEDNSGCEYATCAGCTYEFACNYDPEATIPDNDSCEFGSCPGCTDPEALNYNPTVTEDDGSCEYPPSFNTCGDPVSYQGYDYPTVLIGEQCWFAENLRNENYDNGDAIPSNLSDSEWSTTNSGAVALYGEDGGCQDNSPDIDACDPAQSLEEYGRLYNWFAVDDARGLCPGGWHVPTDGEWTVMTDELGGESIAGGQMKTTYGWYIGLNGTNSSGFSGLPGGARSNDDGYFIDAGNLGVWWSSSPSGSGAWYRNLDLNEFIHRYSDLPRSGFSVRCVRDAE